MTLLLLIGLVVTSGVVLFGITKRLERAAQRPGWAHLIGAVVMLVSGGASLMNGYRVSSVICAVLAVIFMYHAYGRHLVARRCSK